MRKSIILGGAVILILAVALGIRFTGLVSLQGVSHCTGAGSDCSTWNNDNPTCTGGSCSWQDSCYGSVDCESLGGDTCGTYGCSWNSECIEYEQICTEYEQICTEWDEFEECISWTDGDCISWTDGDCISWNEYCSSPGYDCSTWNGDNSTCIGGGCDWQDSCYGSVDCGLLGADTCGSYGCTWNPDPLCGETISESVTLTGDLNCSGGGTGLTIGANDITLDCASHSITGDGTGIGLKFNGVSGATVKNCEISGFDQGILSGNALTSNNFILNNTVQDTSQYGIAIRRASDYIIQYNKITNSDMGIRVVVSSGNVINNNTIIDSQTSSISIFDADSNNITDNTIQDADVHGIYLYTPVAGSNNLVQGNSISLSETDVAPSTKFGIRIEDDDNKFYNNTIDCTSLNPDYPHVGIWTSGSGDNNVFSGNEIFNCDYGFDVWDADYFEVSNDDYHDNTYGVYLQDAGTSLTLPLIKDSRIYNNSHGVYLASSSYANISNTNFTDNFGTEGEGPKSGIHIESTSTAYVANGRFIGNGAYGIYEDEGGDSTYWTINSNALCRNNDIQIANGDIIFDGGTLELDNCTISLNNLLLNLTGNITSLSSETQYVTSDTETDFDFTEVDSNITLMLSSGVTTTIAVFPESPNASGTTASLTALKGIDIQVDSTTSGALTWALIKIFYNESELTAANIDESTLKIYYYNETAADWQLEPNQGVDTADNYIWANITHFSLFGAFGTASAVITSTGGNGGGGGCLTNWTCSAWSKCTNGAQTRNCQKVNWACYGGVRPEETQACSTAKDISTEEPNKPIVMLTSSGWWILVAIIATVSIIVLIVLKLTRHHYPRIEEEY